MKIRPEDLRAMSGVELFELAKKIVVQWFDHQKTKSKIGDWDDALQLISEELWAIIVGESNYDPSRDLVVWVHGVLRGEARSNWQHLHPGAAETEGDGEGEIEDGEPIASTSLSLDDLPSLSALDKLIIRHSTQSKVRQVAATKDIADLLGITTRAVRLRKEKLRARLQKEYKFTIDFFAEAVEPKLPHLNPIKKEKDPLSDFRPLTFFGRRTFGIR